MGPRGVYCLERLCAEYKARPLPDPLQIHVFNRSAHFGTSPIYDPDQPEYILVNVSVGEIDLWTADDPPVAAGRGPGFLAWYDATFRPETPLTGNEYLSRAVVGRYLIEGFQRILSRLPDGVTVTCHIGEVVDLRPVEGGGYDLDVVSGDGRMEEIRVEKVMLATGHSRLLPGPAEKRYQSFAGRHPRAAFIPFVYPVVETMAPIPAGARVAMQGIGLTFIDAVLELTEGRGGRFVRDAAGALSYQRSGREPRTIFPFCRSGLPMTPKAHDLPPYARPLTFFTEEALAGLTDRSAEGKLDLDRDLLPLMELEMEFHYYRAVMGGERHRLDACGSDARAVRRVIDAFLSAHPQVERFDYRRVLDPIGNCEFESGEQFTSFIAGYMEQEIARARRGQAGCAVKGAIDLWYEIRKTLGTVLPFGGLTPESHRLLIDVYYPRFKRVVFGPPIINIEKLLALTRAGLLDFSVARSPCVLTDEAEGCFELRGDRIPVAARAEVLVDARYPATDIPRDATPLYRRLHQRGLVRAFENRAATPSGAGYRPGAIDMTAARFVVGGSGAVNEDIAVIGIPTEGNLVGNLTIAHDESPGAWAAAVMAQLQRAGPASREMTANSSSRA
ncbi:MAG TPA: FAD/NAD(P)-binding protein [Thermoanaerobaculia bacterium]|nr:FAD/NAD(P)-binding protein [Thermoanaerobaculia bacterium]